MNWLALKSQLGRTALVLGVTGGIIVGVGVGAAEAAVGKNPGAVSVIPPSGVTSNTSMWGTDVGCAPGFQGSAVFRAVKPNGTTVNISPLTNSVTTAFNGIFQGGSLSNVQALSGVPNGTPGELVVFCFSGPNGSGSSDPEMDVFITYNANGTYTTSSSVVTTPAGAIGGVVFTALAAIGLTGILLRRRSGRTQRG